MFYGPIMESLLKEKIDTKVLMQHFFLLSVLSFILFATFSLPLHVMLYTWCKGIKKPILSFDTTKRKMKEVYNDERSCKCKIGKKSEHIEEQKKINHV